MDIIAITLLAGGLSMDSLVIALTSGAIIANHRPVNVLKIAGMLAFIQMSLTILGWLLGSTFASHIEQYDHWIAFGILTFLGVKIIIESFKGQKEDKIPFNPLDIKVMFTLALATSIDAMAVGFSLSLVGRPIIVPAVIIGVVTLLLSMVGVISGCRVGQRYNLKFNLIGAVVLILIGLSILLEHTILSQDSMLI